MSARDDGTLLRSFVATGSDEVFRALVDRYAPLVYAVCRGELERPELAEDAAQAVFLLLAQRAGRLRVRTTLVGWLYATARLVCRAARREERRRVSRERALDRDLASAPPDALGIDVHRALARLSTVQREAVVLRFVQGWSLAEVARLQGISEDAARMRVNRALDRMRPALKGHGGEALTGLAVPPALVARATTPAAQALARETSKLMIATPALSAAIAASLVVVGSVVLSVSRPPLVSMPRSAPSAGMVDRGRSPPSRYFRRRKPPHRAGFRNSLSRSRSSTTSSNATSGRRRCAMRKRRSTGGRCCPRSTRAT